MKGLVSLVLFPERVVGIVGAGASLALASLRSDWV